MFENYVGISHHLKTNLINIWNIDSTKPQSGALPFASLNKTSDYVISGPIMIEINSRVRFASARNLRISTQSTGLKRNLLLLLLLLLLLRPPSFSSLCRMLSVHLQGKFIKSATDMRAHTYPHAYTHLFTHRNWPLSSSRLFIILPRESRNESMHCVHESERERGRPTETDILSLKTNTSQPSTPAHFPSRLQCDVCVYSRSFRGRTGAFARVLRVVYPRYVYVYLYIYTHPRRKQRSFSRTPSARVTVLAPRRRKYTRSFVARTNNKTRAEREREGEGESGRNEISGISE